MERSRKGLFQIMVVVAAALLAVMVLALSGPGVVKAALAASRASSSTQCPWVGSHQPIARRVAEVMDHMTLSDEITLVEGQGTNKPYVFYMAGIPRLCIPPMGLEDGPNGVGDGLTGVTQLPAGVSLAATFDPSLAYHYGQVVGAEEAGKGASVNLGPTVNIDRDPRWGRSFETYTEDPRLNAVLATHEIKGVQSRGVMAQVKHYDAYNQETNRNTPKDDVIVSKRVLHEIYMPAFEAAVKQARVASIMCAYSTVNGKYSCQNPYLLTKVLRDEWNFPGFVTSDYAAIHSLSAATAGTDMEQPFSTYFGKPLKQAVESGKIPRAVLNTMVQRILTEMFRFGLFKHLPKGSTSATVTTPAHQALARQVAERGTVLLKNRDASLPLSASHAGSVAVIGPAASASPSYGGGGSAYVIPSKTISPLQGIRSSAGSGTHVIYRQGLPTDTSLPLIPSSALSKPYHGTGSGGNYTARLKAPQTGTYVLAYTNPCGCYSAANLYLNGKEILSNPGTPPVDTYSAAVHLRAGHTYTLKLTGPTSNLRWGTPSHLASGIKKAVAAARSASTAVVIVSDDTESEAADRPSLDLPSAQNELISEVARANPHTVVVVNAGAPVAMPWLDQVAAVVDAWYPGQTSGTALANVLFGKVDPGGHLPVTFPKSLSQVPAHTQARFPGVGGKVHYSEGLKVGYRWYDSKGIKPMFPFGYGLSYTRFRFSNLHLSPSTVDGVHPVHLSATITNVGKSAGSDVAQLYLKDPAAAGEPPRQLVGFQRVKLAPGHSARVHFTVSPRDTWWWDQAEGGWSQSAGTYRVYVGDSSALADLPLRDSFMMKSTPASRQVVVHAPALMHPGKASTVKVSLTASGNETLHNVRLALQVPGGWQVRPVGSKVFRSVPSSASPTATFRVKPPAWAVSANAVVHATADLGGTRSCQANSDSSQRGGRHTPCAAVQRENGVSVRVGS